MSAEPLKKELEAIDHELELAMAQLTETTQRVDDVLANFSADDSAPQRPHGEIIPIQTQAESTDDDDDE